MGDQDNRDKKAGKRLEPLGKSRKKGGKSRIVIGLQRPGAVLISPRPSRKQIAAPVSPQTRAADKGSFYRKLSLRELRVPKTQSPQFRNRAGSDPHRSETETTGEVARKRDCSPEIALETPLELAARRPVAQTAVKKWYSHTQIGTVGSCPKAENQDSLFSAQISLPSCDFSFLGVCDGHGSYGRKVSSYVSRLLPEAVRTAIAEKTHKDCDVWPDVLRNCYEQCAERMKLEEFDSGSSGCTCVSVVVVGGQAICANVGDSRAVLGRLKGQSISAVDLSRDQKPDVPEERQRILRAGGRIEPLRDGDGAMYGPPRIWFPCQDSPGLAMSRAIGDSLSSSLGVIPTPGKHHTELFSLYLTPSDLFVILASDGIWEFISSQEAVSLVFSCVQAGNAELCSERLAAEATKRWQREEDCVDDISVTVAFLQ